LKPHPKIAALLVLVPALTLCVSCRTALPLPPADFSSPGWRVQQGQAVWKPSKNRPELAGDLLLATNTGGNFVIQFSKTPFTLATAQVAEGAWRIEFGGGRYSWRGHGAPPSRFVWFQLPFALATTEPARPWKFMRRADDSWRLENPRTGEFLEGVFFP
jgi:hypothetical protein